MKKKKQVVKKQMVFRLPIFSLSGNKKGTISLNKKVFGIKVNKIVVAQAVRVHLSRCRRSGAIAKTRGEVTGSGAKIWRQKGSGRARHGDRQAPIFVGGGAAHGPRVANWQLKMPKKMKRRAFLSVLSDRYAKKRLVVVDSWEKLPPKTKEAKLILEKLISFSESTKKAEGKICLLFNKTKKEKLRGIRNLKKFTGAKSFSYACSRDVDSYRLLAGNFYLLDKNSIEYFNGLATAGK